MEECLHELVEILGVLRYVVGGGHDLVGYGLLAVDDTVEGGVDGVAPQEVVARDVVLLADAVGPVLTLAAVGVGPRQLYEGHIGRGREREPHSCRLDRADDEAGVSRLEAIDRGLLGDHGVAPGDADSLGKDFAQLIDYLVERAEEDELLARGEEGAREVDGLLDLAFGRQGAQRHEAHEGLHAHLAHYLVVGTLLVGAQVLGEVACGEVVLVAVANIDVEVAARLGRQLGEHLGLFAADHAAGVEVVAEAVEVFALAIVGEKQGLASELVEAPHDGELGHEVFGPVDDGRAREQDDPLLAGTDPLGEDGLLSRRVLDAVGLVDDDGAKHAYLRTEDHVFQPETLAALDVPDEVLAQRLIVDDGHLVHAHLQEVGPRGARSIVEDERVLVCEALELSLPVDF